MSDSNIARPDAEQPATVAGKLHDEFGVHASGSAEFYESRVEYKVSAWVDDDTDAKTVHDLADVLDDSGYDLGSLSHIDTTDSVRVTGQATTE